MLFVLQGPDFDQAPDDVPGEDFAALARQTGPCGVLVHVKTRPLTARTWPTVEHGESPKVRIAARLDADGVAASATTIATTTNRAGLIRRTVARPISPSVVCLRKV